MNFKAFVKKTLPFTAPQTSVTTTGQVLYILRQRNFFQKLNPQISFKGIVMIVLAVFAFFAIPIIKETSDIAEARFRRNNNWNHNPQTTPDPTDNTDETDPSFDPSSTPQPSITPTPSVQPSASTTPSFTPKPSQSPNTSPSSTPTPTPPTSTTPATTLTMKIVTFYGWPDNDPPGTAIAFPKSGSNKSIHSGASGTGTFDDPISFASDPKEFPNGTKLYVPYLKKYVIMEDTCAQCISDWSGGKNYHIDLWMNGDNRNTDKLLSCQNYWTKENMPIEVNPPANREVILTPLFDPATGICQKTIGAGVVAGVSTSILNSTPSPIPTPKPAATPIPSAGPLPTTTPVPNITVSGEDYIFKVKSGDSVWRLSRKAVDQLISDEGLDITPNERQDLINTLVDLQGPQSLHPNQTYTIPRTLMEQAVQETFF